ncbi:sensor histidine kinase [Streptomyces sp. NPDC059991]|uniref:sensor histidine kinase n=1 Tax=Streptomyces sp. NPDC059991 TaxID=3347028 RepID=UPI0036A8B711
MRRCIENLLSSAVKFSPEGTPATVCVGARGCTCATTGPGIAPEERDAVFDRSHRGPPAQAIPVSGLGIAIVHDLVTAGHGTVFAAAAPDGGAEAGFRLPPHDPAACT